MFAIFNPPHVKRKRFKRRKKFSFFTPGGGRITAFNKALGSFNRRHRAASLGGHTMARGRRRGRHVRFNGLSFAAPKQSSGKFGLASMSPKALLRNLSGAAPILGGVVVDGMLTKFLSAKIPYTGRGIGQIALGLAGAGVLKWAGGMSKMKGLGEGLFVGGVVGTLACAFQSFMREGIRSLSLSDDLDGLGYNDVWQQNQYTASSFNGLGEFVSPRQIQGAIPSGNPISQYSLPNANAQFSPGAHLQPAHTPAQAASARHMADYEASAIGAMVGDNSSGGGAEFGM